MPGQVISVKKKRGPAPTGQGKVVGVRIHDDLMKLLDEWIAEQPGQKSSKSEAIRAILRERLDSSTDLKG